MPPREIETKSPGETEAVGSAFGRAILAPGLPARTPALLLHGPLGAGKTCLVRGLARGLGCRVTPRSPTFALHLTYDGERVLHHIDLYRLRDETTMDELGLEDLFSGPGVVVVEWAERLGALEPAGAVHITLTPTGENERRIRLDGPVEWVDRLMASLGGVAARE